jgi:hypothetical protein
MRRTFRDLLVLIACLGASAPAFAAPKAVVELFTSQGCSTCRSADEYMAELADRDDVVALSLHVDYWDYLGWKDTFGSPEHSERQSAYGAGSGDRKVYTPQIVVNGTAKFVGGDRPAIEAAIGDGALPVPVALAYENDKLEIRVGPNIRPAPWRTTIRLVLYTSTASVGIQKGENSGSTITYRNIVREIRPIGMWDGPLVAISLPADEILTEGADGCAVLVQEEGQTGPGAIVGAARLPANQW